MKFAREEALQRANAEQVLQLKFADLSKELISTQKDFELAKNDRSANGDEKLQVMQRELRSMERKLHQAKETLQASQTECADFKGRYGSLSIRFKEVELALGTGLKELEEMKWKCETADFTLSQERQSHNKSLRKLEGEVSSLQGQVEILETHGKEREMALATAIEDAACASEEADGVRREMRVLIDNTAILTADLTGAQEALSLARQESNQRMQEVVEFKQKIAKLEIHVGDLLSQLEKSEIRFNESVVTISQIKDEKIMVQESYAEIKGVFEQEKAKTQKLSVEKEALELEVSSQQSHLATLDIKIERQECIIDDLRGQIAALKAENTSRLPSLQKSLEEQKGIVGELKIQLAEVKAYKDTVDGHNKELSQTLADMGAQKMKVEEAALMNEQIRRKSEATLRDIEAQMDSLSEESQKLSVENSELRASVDGKLMA